MRLAWLAALLLILSLSSAQSIGSPEAISDTRSAITSALSHPSVVNFAKPDSVVVALRVRQYIVVTIYQSCAWRGVCKDGSMKVVFNPSKHKIALVIGSG